MPRYRTPSALTSGGVLTKLQGGTAGTTSNTQFAVSGLVLIAVVVFAPDGVSLLITRTLRRLGRRT